MLSFYVFLCIDSAGTNKHHVRLSEPTLQRTASIRFFHGFSHVTSGTSESACTAYTCGAISRRASAHKIRWLLFESSAWGSRRVAAIKLPALRTQSNSVRFWRPRNTWDIYGYLGLMISLIHLDSGSLSRTFIASCSKSWCRRKTIETEMSPAALGDCRCCDCNEQSHCCWSPFECGYWNLLFTFLPNLNGITLCKSPDKRTSRRRCGQKPGSHHHFQPFHYHPQLIWPITEQPFCPTPDVPSALLASSRDTLTSPLDGDSLGVAAVLLVATRSVINNTPSTREQKICAKDIHPSMDIHDFPICHVASTKPRQESIALSYRHLAVSSVQFLLRCAASATPVDNFSVCWFIGFHVHTFLNYLN